MRHLRGESFEKVLPLYPYAVLENRKLWNFRTPSLLLRICNMALCEIIVSLHPASRCVRLNCNKNRSQVVLIIRKIRHERCEFWGRDAKKGAGVICLVHQSEPCSDKQETMDPQGDATSRTRTPEGQSAPFTFWNHVCDLGRRIVPLEVCCAE